MSDDENGADEEEKSLLEDSDFDDDDNDDDDESSTDSEVDEESGEKIERGWLYEWKSIISLSGPLFLAYAGGSIMSTSDMAVVGHLDNGPETLAAINLALTIMLGSSVIASGVINALATLTAQAAGAEEHRTVGIWLQVALFWVTTFLVLPIGVVWFFTGNLLNLFDLATEPHVVLNAQSYARWSLIGLIPQNLNSIIGVWLESIDVVLPQTVITIVFIGINLGLAILLVFGAGDWQGLGLIGSAIATSLSASLQFLTLYVYCFLIKGVHKPYWFGWSFEMFSCRRARTFFKLGIPILLTEVIFDWVFEILVIMAAHLGTAHVAAMGVLVNLVFFLTPTITSVYVATSIRVAHQLGKNKVPRSKKSAWAGIHIALFVSVLCGLILYFLRRQLPYVFVEPDEASLANMVTQSMAFVAVDFFFASLSYVMQGILEGQALPHFATMGGFIGNWVITLPIGYVFVFVLNAGVNGFWIGLIIGEIAKFFILCLCVFMVDWQKAADTAIRVASDEREQEKARLLERAEKKRRKQAQLQQQQPEKHGSHKAYGGRRSMHASAKNYAKLVVDDDEISVGPVVVEHKLKNPASQSQSLRSDGGVLTEKSRLLPKTSKETIN